MFLILVLAVVSAVECSDIEHLLTRFPLPQPNFNLNKYRGDWCVQKMYAPASWSGSKYFNDYVTELGPQIDPMTFYVDVGFRSANAFTCTYVKETIRTGFVPGVFDMKDKIGDVHSGDLVVVATDYISHAVEWGCTKKVGGTCVDPHVNVKTRAQYPSKATMAITENIVMSLWGLSQSAMANIHQHNPCKYFPRNQGGPLPPPPPAPKIGKYS